MSGEKRKYLEIFVRKRAGSNYKEERGKVTRFYGVAVEFLTKRDHGGAIGGIIEFEHEESKDIGGLKSIL